MIDIIRAFVEDFPEKEYALAAGLVNPRNHELPDAVRVERIIPYDRSSTFRRLWSWVVGFLQICWMVITRYRKAHLFIVSNPPLASLLPLFCRNPYSLLIYDVYPDALVEYNIFSAESLIIRQWKSWNKRIYARAKAVFTLSDGMKKLLMQYAPSNSGNIHVVPVWTDNSFLRPILKAENEFRQAQALEDCFLVMYSGNLGKSHELSILVDLARRVHDDDIFVLIIGGGDQYQSLKSKIQEAKLPNMRILPWQPTETLPQTLAAADLGVVSLGKEASLLSMPSKTFNLLSVGCPILAIASPESALADMVVQYDLGQHFEPSQIDDITAFVKQLARNQSEQQRLQRNALQTAHLFGPENARKFVLPFITAQA